MDCFMNDTCHVLRAERCTFEDSNQPAPCGKTYICIFTTLCQKSKLMALDYIELNQILAGSEADKAFNLSFVFQIGLLIGMNLLECSQ